MPSPPGFHKEARLNFPVWLEGMNVSLQLAQWQQFGLAFLLGTTEPSSPQITRVVFNFVLCQETQELLLERLLAMMLLLFLDVRHRNTLLRYADGERAVSFLPAKLLMLRKRVVNPFRRFTFDDLNRFRNRQGRRQ